MLTAFALALIWAIVPAWAAWSVTRSRKLDEYEPMAMRDQPRVSVIVPARNEALNIERCVRSILRSTYANLELIVVDDHSTDDTRVIAQRVIGDDARARITTPPPLAAGWFGKQWACAHGASLATGALLLFTDADTWHGSDLLARAVGAVHTRDSDLLTLIGEQETHSFWEMVVQPAVFLILLAGVGNLDAMERAASPRRKAANGQFILARRDRYEALDGHEAVRMYVAEDVMLAQLWSARGMRIHALYAPGRFSTRMYTSLRDLINGWRKNWWAGGRHAFGDNATLRAVMRVLLPFAPLGGVVPVLAMIIGALTSHWLLLFGIAAYVVQTIALTIAFTVMQMPRMAAPLYPLGSAICAYIATTAAIRGDRTEWKGREYTAA